MSQNTSRTRWSDVVEPPQQPEERRPRWPLLRRILTSRQTRWGLLLLIAMVLFALIGPFFSPYPPTETIGGPFQAPGGAALFGTDEIGRDVWSRVLHGGVNLTWMSVVAAMLGVALGAAVGLTAAYFGRGVDTTLMRIMDGMLAFPPLVFAILFIAMIGPSLWLLVLLVALGHMPGVSRTMRGAAMPVVAEEYVLWSRAVGLPARKLLLHQVLPNVLSPLMVEFGLRIMWSLALIASLSFIGYGIQPPSADWGLMVSENRSALAAQPVVVLIPVACIALFTIGTNLFSEGIARIVGRTEGKRS